MSEEPVIHTNSHISWMCRHLAVVASRITVRMILTPRSELVCVDAEAPVQTARGLIGNAFDQLPVISGAECVGLVTSDNVAEALADATVRSVMRPLEAVSTVHADDVLATAVRDLVDQPCVLVLDATDSVCGLVHFSDLNKGPVRANAYLWISALEMGLAALVRRLCPDMDGWISKLGEHRQLLILGRYELDRRRKVELSPVEGTDLSDLINISKSTPAILEVLGFSKAQFAKKSGHLVKLRHAVMHPVRAMFHAHEDVRKLIEFREDLMEILDAVYAVLESDDAAENRGGNT